MSLIITIDGPAGTGKSTVSRMVASRLGLPHLDTGAYYRAATVAAIRRGIDMTDPAAMASAVRAAFLDQVGAAMYLDGEDISKEIRGKEVNAAVSVVSAHPEVRAALVEHQRAWVELHGGSAVVEGRDIGSIVFPDAALKVYLDASPEIRARRRALQVGADVDVILAEQAKRDHLDSTRAVSPLTIPAGAVVVDTTDLTVDEVVDRIVSLAQQDSA